MDDSDPLYTFFPESLESSSPQTVLYQALNLPPSATGEEIRKAYRRQALQYHPDKHQSKSEKDKEDLSKKFQRIGFAYSVLSDEKAKKRYDATGKTSDKFDGIGEGEGGWEGYFESLFKRVDRKILDEDKQRYQGSDEEKSDIISSYNSTKGSLPSILNYIPHCTYTDEDRFVTLINGLISSGDLEKTEKWEKTSTDEKAKEKRRKSGEKQAKEAEKQAKELGVWNEFYGDGEKGSRKSSASKKEKETTKNEGGAGDVDGTGLGALIMKRQRERENGLNALEEKYRKIEEERASKKAKKGKANAKANGKAKKGGDEGQDQENVVSGMPDISDADFQALQAKMFAKKDNDKPLSNGNSRAKKSKTR
ncbi:uncharacterized protein I303_106110 [Kwoniella dejecticola CBS 10117]|uniref:DNAJ domain-containing protein n=1 Tax=Kwoniella dejecticola CBS 10117 TaxID=1296121 RepID=A0A1A6A1A9_9TREE|nr:DNAJ domain-containing protein [Kwoniella dejecticola CBS 10117]OBR83846.1 DNAJ domain-containing protein [Kwoniella dejecticola CBS 10117]